MYKLIEEQKDGLDFIKKSDLVLDELTKDDSKAIQGIALLFMLMLHLFCRRDVVPYDVFLYINDVPLLYYLGLWGDQCVALFCFCAGYASFLQQERHKKQDYISQMCKRVLRLLINYWIVILIFSIIGMLVGKGSVIPGSFVKFLGNMFLFNISYNGAWWFMLTYVLLMFLSIMIHKLVKRCNGIILCLIFGGIYFIAYLFRFEYISMPISNYSLNWFVQQSALLGTSILPFVWGMLFYKYKIISMVRKKGKEISSHIKFGLSIILFLFCIITHGIVQSLIIAPLYAMITVVVISLWENRTMVFLKYVGENSTNMWLVHMFFYTVIFPDFIFVFRYPILIYLAMFLLSLVFSILINFILKKTIDKLVFVH